MKSLYMCLVVLQLCALSTSQQSSSTSSTSFSNNVTATATEIMAQSTQQLQIDNTTSLSLPVTASMGPVTSSYTALSTSQLTLSSVPRSLAVPSETTSTSLFPTISYNTRVTESASLIQTSVTGSLTTVASFQTQPSTSVDMFTPETSTQTTTTTSSSDINSSTVLSPTPPVEDTSPRNAIEFIKDNPVAFALIGGSFAFLSSMCCCLVCVTICKKRSRARSKKRQRQIQDTTRDVSIANRGAMERGESPEPLYETGQMQQHTAAVNALQTAPSEAVIFSNPNLDTDLPPQYKQLQHLSSHTSFAAAPPTHSTSWLAVHEQLGSRQIDPQPSAPTPDNFVVSIVESLTS